MEGDDAARERAIRDIAESGFLDHLHELVLTRKAAHACREVLVGRASRQRPPQHRDDPLEPDPVERGERAGGLRDLEDPEPPSGYEHARELGERKREIGDVTNSEADGCRVESLLVERQRERIALDPGDGVRLPPRALDHPRREVEPDDAARTGTSARQRKVARTAACVEHAVAGPHDRLGCLPPPAPVEARGHDVVHHVVDRRDAVEHRADALRRQRPRLDAGERVAALGHASCRNASPEAPSRPRGRWRGCEGWPDRRQLGVAEVGERGHWRTRCLARRVDQVIDLPLDAAVLQPSSVRFGAPRFVLP